MTDSFSMKIHLLRLLSDICFVQFNVGYADRWLNLRTSYDGLMTSWLTQESYIAPRTPDNGKSDYSFVGTTVSNKK